MVGGVVLVTDVLLNRDASIGIGAGLVLLGAIIWLVVPMSVRRRGHRPDQI